ncbi:MAG: hypothetical protein C5B52_12555 [Bacteroidetes bacterium]|nr:MAG: hypothetical protein C5B52_12555 [Bacteroidota bacterium]
MQMEIPKPLPWLLASFLFFSLSSKSQNTVSVITQHNNIGRTGWNNQETILNHANVSSTQFGCIATLSVDDEVYAQPLVVRQTTIGTHTGSVLFVATVNNSLYAFDADSVANGAPLWQVNLSPAGQRAPTISDLQDPVEGSPCGGNYRDFSGRFGIVGTPVIDTTTSTLYVATKTVDASGMFRGYMNAIDIHTGQHKTGSPKLIDVQISGSGAGSAGNILRYDAKYQNQRPGLLLYNNTVYAASASHCDWGPYHGWILGFDAQTLDLKYTYNATPNGWAGGIWMAGQGISVGEDGNLYVVTGNGTTSSDNSDFINGRSESLIKLSPQLGLLDWFTPADYQYLDDNDLDYGCDGVLMIPNSSLTVSGSKQGISYVVDYNAMGRFSDTNNSVVDTIEFNSGRQGDVHVHGSPVYAKFSTGEFVYGWSESFKMRRFTLDRSTNTFDNNFQEGNRNLDYGMPGAMLSISSNQDDTSSAIIWTSFPSSGNANNQVRPGTVSAYRANDITGNALWTSDNNSPDVVGKFAKFNPTTIANGKVYVPTFSHAIKVYGLKCAGALTGLAYGNGAGLKAEYFSNASNTGPEVPNLVQLDPSINFNWGQASPAPGISSDQFKVRWSGKLLPLTDDNYNIYITASDRVRVTIDGNLIIDSWTDQTITTHTASIALQRTKTYDIVVEYYSNTNPASCILQWSANGICRQNIPTSQLLTEPAVCNSDGKGLFAEYFTNTAAGGNFPAVATSTKIEPGINFDWGGGSPAGISQDLFKARFTGYVQSLDSGSYTFYATADDGIRVWVNNQLIIDAWVDQPASEYTGTITLEKCKKNQIRIEYYENAGDAVCKLEWSGPLFGRQQIATTQLYKDLGPLPNNKEFVVYPNPNYIHRITIALSDGLKEGDQIQFYNMLGQLVQTNYVNAGNAGQYVTVPIHLPAGMYFVKVQTKTKKYSSKVVVF